MALELIKYWSHTCVRGFYLQAEEKWAKAGRSLSTRRLYSVSGCYWIKDCRLLFHHPFFISCVTGINSCYSSRPKYTWVKEWNGNKIMTNKVITLGKTRQKEISREHPLIGDQKSLALLRASVPFPLCQHCASFQILVPSVLLLWAILSSVLCSCAGFWLG